MNVIVAITRPLFDLDDSNRYVNCVAEQIRRYGHTVDVIVLPRDAVPGPFTRFVVSCRLMRIERADIVVCLDLFSAFIPHDNKVLWFGQGLSVFEKQHHVLAVHDHCSGIDTPLYFPFETIVRLMSEVNRVFTHNEEQAHFLKKYLSIQCKYIRIPPLMTEQTNVSLLRNTVICPAPILESGHHVIAIDALRFLDDKFQVLFSGPVRNSSYLEYLLQYAQEQRLSHRVVLATAHETQHSMAAGNFTGDIILDCSTVRNSYSCSAHLAFAYRTPVVTCVHSHHLASVIDHQITGVVSINKGKALAKHIRDVVENREVRDTLITNGCIRLCAETARWDFVVRDLFS